MAYKIIQQICHSSTVVLRMAINSNHVDAYIMIKKLPSLKSYLVLASKLPAVQHTHSYSYTQCICAGGA